MCSIFVYYVLHAIQPSRGLLRDIAPGVLVNELDAACASATSTNVSPENKYDDT